MFLGCFLEFACKYKKDAYNVIMEYKKLIAYWTQSSDDDFEAVEVLYRNKQYVHCLFFGHLVIEKLFKALYAKIYPKEPYAPKSHDLLFLARKCGIELDLDKKILLDIINSFNINARYESYKNEFRKQCTEEFADEQIKNIEDVRKWLKTLIAQ